MVLVTPELCCRYPTLISPNFGTRGRVLLQHFPELQKQVEMEGRGGGKKTGVVVSQASTTGKGGTTEKTAEDGVIAALDGA